MLIKLFHIAPPFFIGEFPAEFSTSVSKTLELVSRLHYNISKYSCYFVNRFLLILGYSAPVYTFNFTYFLRICISHDGGILRGIPPKTRYFSAKTKQIPHSEAHFVHKKEKAYE